MKTDLDAADGDALAIPNGLRAPGEVVTIAQPHQIERFLRRQHGAVTRAGVIAMGMRDEGTLDRICWIDVEFAERAAHAATRSHHDVLRPHGAEIIISSGRRRPLTFVCRGEACLALTSRERPFGGATHWVIPLSAVAS